MKQYVYFAFLSLRVQLETIELASVLVDLVVQTELERMLGQ